MRRRQSHMTEIELSHMGETPQRPPPGATRPRGPDRHARPTGPRPVGHPRDRRGRAPCTTTRQAPRRPTGRRSSPGTTTSSPSPTTRCARTPAAMLGRAVAVGHVLGAAAGLRETDRLRNVIGKRHRWHAVRGHLHELGGDLPAAATAYTPRPPAGPRTSPSATTWSVRPPARGRPSYVGTVISLSVLHRLAYPAMTRLSRATHRWSLQTNGRRVPAGRSATEIRCS
jgi:hypothetical protein